MWVGPPPYSAVWIGKFALKYPKLRARILLHPVGVFLFSRRYHSAISRTNRDANICCTAGLVRIYLRTLYEPVALMYLNISVYKRILKTFLMMYDDILSKIIIIITNSFSGDGLGYLICSKKYMKCVHFFKWLNAMAVYPQLCFDQIYFFYYFRAANIGMLHLIN